MVLTKLDVIIVLIVNQFALIAIKIAVIFAIVIVFTVIIGVAQSELVLHCSAFDFGAARFGGIITSSFPQSSQIPIVAVAALSNTVTTTTTGLRLCL